MEMPSGRPDPHHLRLGSREAVRGAQFSRDGEPPLVHICVLGRPLILLIFATPLVPPCGPTVLPRPANQPSGSDFAPSSTHRCTSVPVGDILLALREPSMGQAAVLPLQKSLWLLARHLDPISGAAEHVRAAWRQCH